MMKTCILIVTLLLAGCSTTPQQAGRPVETTYTTIGNQDADLLQTADDAYARSDWETARASYELLVRQYPADARYWYRLGNIYSFTDKLDAAVVCYRQALDLAPDITDAWQNLGMTHMKQAAYSFNGMLSRSPEQSAEASRAQRIIDGILELLQTTE